MAPTGTATFGKSSQAKITSQSDQLVGTLQFNAGSSDYNSPIASGIFGFSGDGIVTQSGAGAVKFIVDSELDFFGASKAANATIVNRSLLIFTDGASADRARIEKQFRCGSGLLCVEQGGQRDHRQSLRRLLRR